MKTNSDNDKSAMQEWMQTLNRKEINKLRICCVALFLESVTDIVYRISNIKAVHITSIAMITILIISLISFLISYCTNKDRK